MRDRIPAVKKGKGKVRFPEEPSVDLRQAEKDHRLERRRELEEKIQQEEELYQQIQAQHEESLYQLALLESEQEAYERAEKLEREIAEAGTSEAEYESQPD